MQIDTGGDYFPCERAAKITAAGPQNEYPEKQRCGIHCCGGSLSFQRPALNPNTDSIFREVEAMFSMVDCYHFFSFFFAIFL